MQQAHNPKHSPNRCIAVAPGCTMSEASLCSQQEQKRVSMNVTTYVFAHSRGASIIHAFDAHSDHCGSKCVNRLNDLLYPR